MLAHPLSYKSSAPKLYYSPQKARQTRSVSPSKQAYSSDLRLPPLLTPVTYSPYLDSTIKSQKRKSARPSPLSRPREQPTNVGFIYRTGGDGTVYKPTGMGILIAKSVVLTSRTVIHTEETAGKYRISFAGKEGLHFQPEVLFVGAVELNLVVVAVDEKAGEYGEVLDIVQRFTLKEGDKAGHVGVALQPSRVKIVEPQRFYFRSENSLLPGTPVFDSFHRFQGLTISPSTSYFYNETIRVDAITTSLLASGNFLKHNSGLKSLLSRIYYTPIQEQDTEPREQLCWFEWLHQRVIKYDVANERWTTLTAESLDGQQDWHFLWDSKPVQLPDSTYLLLGGSLSQSPSTEVLHYSPVRNRLTRCERLNLGRLACAVACCTGAVYAFGGEYSNGSCEKYPLSTLKWTYVSPLPYSRHGMNAVVMADLAYIVGGLPLQQAGHSIDRYYPQSDQWEKLDVSVPEQVCNSGLCLLTADTFAILGGRLSRRVFTVQVTGLASSFLVSAPHTVTFHESMELSRNAETLYPGFLSSQTATVYLFNSHEAQHRPVLVKYNAANFTQAPGKRGERSFTRLEDDSTTPLSTSFLY